MDLKAAVNDILKEVSIAGRKGDIEVATKLNDTTLEKSDEDEPIFVLVARDELATKVVGEWIRLAMEAGVNREKIDDAIRLQVKMVVWGRQHGRRLPD